MAKNSLMDGQIYHVAEGEESKRHMIKDGPKVLPDKLYHSPA